MSQCYICHDVATERTDYYRKEAHMCKSCYTHTIDIFYFIFDNQTSTREPNLIDFVKLSYNNKKMEECIKIIKNYLDTHKKLVFSKKVENCNKCPDSIFSFPRNVENENGYIDKMCRHLAREKKETHYCCKSCSFRFLRSKDASNAISCTRCIDMKIMVSTIKELYN